MRSPFGGGAFSSGGIADPEADDGGGSDDDSGGDTPREGGDARLRTVADRQDDSGGGSVGPSRQGRDDRTAGDAGATITSQPEDDDSGGGGGGGGGSVGSVTRDRGGAGAGGGGEPTTGLGADDVADAVTETQAGAPQLDESLSDAASVVGQQAAEFREFQDETTPVRDLGRQTRDVLGLPSEAEVAEATNEAIADVAGISPRQARLGARSSVLSGVDEGVDTAVDAVPEDERGLAAGATALALAEPTPFGEAALLGATVAGGLGGSAITDPEQGEQLVPESPFVQPEIDAPSEPAGEQPGEVDAPDRPQGSRPEIEAPGGADFGVGSEIDVGDGTDTGIDPGIATGGAVGDQPGVDDGLGPDSGIGNPFDTPTGPTITEDDGGSDIVVDRDSSIRFPGDSGIDTVGDDVIGQGTDVTTGETVGTGVGESAIDDVGISLPGQPPGTTVFTPGEVNRAPADLAGDLLDDPTDTTTDQPPQVDIGDPPTFETPPTVETPPTTQTETPTETPTVTQTATPTVTPPATATVPQTGIPTDAPLDLPPFLSEASEDEDRPLFTSELEGTQAIDARLDPVEFDDV